LSRGPAQDYRDAIRPQRIKKQGQPPIKKSKKKRKEPRGNVVEEEYLVRKADPVVTKSHKGRPTPEALHRYKEELKEQEGGELELQWG